MSTHVPLGLRLGEAQKAVQKRYTAALDAEGLSFRRCAFLSHAAANPELSQQAIGAAIGLDRTSTMRLVDELESAGLVKREQSGRDRRIVHVRIQDKAIDKIERFRHAIETVDRHILEKLTQDEFYRLIYALDGLSEKATLERGRAFS